MPRVLLVEDDPARANILTRLIVLRGVGDVRHAVTVAEALSILDPPPDWAILDMELPDGSGLVVLESIRKVRLSTRVVVSSATMDSDLIAVFTAHRPELIIPKPLAPALLPLGLVGNG